MKKFNLISLIFVGVIFLFSCTMEKRLYRDGYHTEWHLFNKKATTEKTVKSVVDKNVQNADLSYISDISESEKNYEHTSAVLEVSPIEELLFASIEETPVTVTKVQTVPKQPEVKSSINTPSRVEIQKPSDQQLRNKAKNNKDATQPMSNDRKSQFVALILCFFVGCLGVHRFYLGYTGIGIIQLLTGGGCGLWTLIDFIRILTGDLKPKDGNYAKTL